MTRFATYECTGCDEELFVETADGEPSVVHEEAMAIWQASHEKQQKCFGYYDLIEYTDVKPEFWDGLPWREEK